MKLPVGNFAPGQRVWTTLICWCRSIFFRSSLLCAICSPFTVAPARLVPRNVKTGIVLSSSWFDLPYYSELRLKMAAMACQRRTGAADPREAGDVTPRVIISCNSVVTAAWTATVLGVS